MVGNKRDKNPELITLESKAAAHEWFTQNVPTHLNQARGKTFMGQEKIPAKEKPSTARLRKLNTMVESVCGIYTRVARRFGLHRSFVSRVARGERRSEPVENVLLAELKRFEDR
jgi:DNA invertase Pin-like site-specific DNA recombinase